jgi:hypothetical protein
MSHKKAVHLSAMLLLSLAIGCATPDRVEPTNTRPESRVTIVPPDPDEMEARAKELPACRLPNLDATLSNARIHKFGPVQVELPVDILDQPEVSSADQALWIARDSSVFLLTVHDGGASTTISPQQASERPAYEESCSVEFAGRVATVWRYQLIVQDRRFYLAAVDVAYDHGRGVGAAIMASSIAKRDSLLAAIPMIRPRGL